jgi:site-specific DNA-methyltransferase (adenine-specific)
MKNKPTVIEKEKKYQIIYADPAWHFGSKQLQKYSGKRFSKLDKFYENSSSEVFERLNVKEITDSDCALFMWTTDAHIPNALKLGEAWGFNYKTVAFIWRKLTNKGNQISTLGAWTMKNCELCLFFTKGRMLKYKKSNNIRQLIGAERTYHSKKPDIFAKEIESLFGDLPRLEMFARDKKEGWDVWGNEVESDINLL